MIRTRFVRVEGERADYLSTTTAQEMIKLNHKALVVTFFIFWAVVVAQWAVQSLPIPEDLGSKPVISNFY